MKSKATTRIALVCATLLIALVVGCKQRLANLPEPESAPVIGKVKLTIDADGLRPTEQLSVPLVEGMTVFQALLAATLDSETTGSGQDAFVTSIGGIKSDDRVGGKSWIYYVNGKQGNMGSDLYTLKPDDAIIWRFEKFSE
ncbi:MAG: DUF4430 domain-containing protein [Pirellulales bacterium]